MLSIRSLTLPAIALLCTAALSPVHAAEHTVLAKAGKASEMRFEPQDIEIAPGDTVIWVNDSAVYHNVKTQTVPEGAAAFTGKGLYKKGDKWSYTFDKSGRYDYFCVPHKGMGMVGSVTVK